MGLTMPGQPVEEAAMVEAPVEQAAQEWRQPASTIIGWGPKYFNMFNLRNSNPINFENMDGSGNQAMPLEEHATSY